MIYVFWPAKTKKKYEKRICTFQNRVEKSSALKYYDWKIYNICRPSLLRWLKYRFILYSGSSQILNYD